MSYAFDGVDDVLNFTLAADLTGAWTFAHIVKFDAGVGWQSLFSQDNSSNASLIATGRYGINGTFATFTGGGANIKENGTVSSSDGWVLLCAARPAGTNQIVRYLKYPIGGSPTFSSSAAPGHDNQATQAGGKTVFGEIDGGDFFKGKLAVGAIWSTNLSDANMQSLGDTMTRANWLSLSPAALWDETDQFATDKTGNGKNRTLLTGTTSDADNPTGWASWAGGTDYTGTVPGAAASTASGPLPGVTTVVRPYVSISVS